MESEYRAFIDAAFKAYWFNREYGRLPGERAAENSGNHDAAIRDVILQRHRAFVKARHGHTIAQQVSAEIFCDELNEEFAREHGYA
jgi:hypothetical protein